MTDLLVHLKRVTRISFFFLSVCFLCWAVFPRYQPIFGGLVIGVLASVINMYHLGWKVHKVGGAAAERTGRRVTLGYPTRAAFALLAVLVSTRTLHFDLFATIVGLIFSQLATLVLGYLSTARSKDSDSSDERGEKE